MEEQSSNSKEFSEDFKQHMHDLSVQWKSLLKHSKKVLLKCPNYEKCRYKCSSIGGMQYHYPRCAGACPVFKCPLCGREYESRTGLNYHNASHHTGVGVALNLSDNKRSQRKDRKAENNTNKVDVHVPPHPPPIVSIPIVSAPVVSTYSSTPVVPTVSHISPSLSTPTLSLATPPVIPSLLKHSNNNNSAPIKKTNGKTKKATRTNKSTKSTVAGDTVSLEGVVKSPGGTDKKITISIPSIEYPDEYRSYLPDWRDQLKATQTVKCPNYDNCQFQCTTVNGMKYHFIRCQKDKLPEFSCSLCDRSFHCRSGLVWHLKNTHKLADLPTNQKTIEVSVSKSQPAVKEDSTQSRRGRKRKPQQPSLTSTAQVLPSQITTRNSSRKNEYPRPTAKFYLKYLETQEKPVSYIKPTPTAWFGAPPPIPKLHPPTALSPVDPNEFTINDLVPTDKQSSDTLVVEYSEETLTQWHKWYSSDSEDYDEDDDDDDDDDDDNEGAGLTNEDSTRSFKQSRDSYTSGSNESSDEDYMECAYVRGRGRGRGQGRGRKRGADSGRSFVPAIPSLLSMGGGGGKNLVKPVKLQPKPVHKPSIEKPLLVTGNANNVPVQPVVINKDLKQVKLVNVNQPKPIKPAKLVNMVVAQGKPQQSSSSLNPVISISPGNYYQVQSVSSANLVPLQIVSPVKNSYQVPSGSLVLVQQPGSQPQYATIQTNVSTPQKVSVIMNPRAVTLATVHIPSSRGTISQFDGPKGKRKANTSQKKLDEEFEQVKKKAKLSVDKDDHNGEEKASKGKRGGRRGKTPLEKEEPKVTSTNEGAKKRKKNVDILEKEIECEPVAPKGNKKMTLNKDGQKKTIDNKRQKKDEETLEEIERDVPVTGDGGEECSGAKGKRGGRKQRQKAGQKETGGTEKQKENEELLDEKEVGGEPMVTEGGDGDEGSVTKGKRGGRKQRQKVGQKETGGTEKQKETLEEKDVEPMVTEGGDGDEEDSVTTKGKKGKQKTPSNKKGQKKTSVRKNTKKGKTDDVMIIEEETGEEPMDGTGSKKGNKGRTSGKKRAASVKGSGVNGHAEEDSCSVEAAATTAPAKKKKNLFVCPTCQEEFTNKRAYKTHTETNHFPVSPNATMAERTPHWRQSIRRHKHATCDKCHKYKGKSVTGMKYHYERCNISDDSQKLSFVCNECSKSYTSQPGLAYHKRYHHAKPLERKESSPVHDLSSPLSRKAAKSASKKMQEMSKQTVEEGGSDTGDNISTTPLSLDGQDDEDHPLSQTNTKLLKSILIDKGVVECPKGCGQKYTTFPGLKYHLEIRHLFFKKFSCPKCKKILTSKKRIMTHMTKKHPQYEVDDYDDLEYTPLAAMESIDDSDDEDDSVIMDGDDIEGKKRRKKGGREKGGREKIEFKRFPHFEMFGSDKYLEVVEILRNKLHSTESLFDTYQPQISDYQKVNDKEFNEYSPINGVSMKYDDDNVAEEEVELFKTSSNGNVFFTGGPVWCMDWLPSLVELECGSCTQYVALTAYRTLLEEHSIEDVFHCKGLIQLWSLGDLKNESDSTNLHFDLGICHEWGIIRNMKWCPSGTTNKYNTPTSPENLPRLGLLALGCSDGNVRLISVPHPSSIDSISSTNSTHSSDSAPSNHIIKSNKVTALLRPGYNDIHFGQCLTIDWLPDNGHTKIVAGYSNGSILIWNISSSLPSFSRHTSDSQHFCFFPALFLTNHNGPCRSLSWFPIDSNYLFSVGHDKTVCCWDIRQPHAPLQKLERSHMLLKALTPFVWSSLFVLEESLTIKPTGSMFMPFLLTSPSHVTTLPTSSDPIASIGYNVWEDCITCGSFGGDVSTINLSYRIHCLPSGIKNIVRRKQNIMSCRVDKLTTPSNLKEEKPSYHSYTVDEVNNNFKIVFEMKQEIDEVYSNDCMPLSAVTSLSWSPHSNSHRWIMVALNCGLVKVVRTKS